MAEERKNEELFVSMDRAAEEAKKEFDSMPEEIKKKIALWMRKWYLKAGYRRLGRIAVSYAKELERQGKEE